MLGKNEGRRRRGQQDEMVGWHWLALDGITNSMDMSMSMSSPALGVGDEQGSLTCCSPWGQRVGHGSETELN